MNNPEQIQPTSDPRRKTPLWEPIAAGYGATADGTLFVGFDTEHKRSENRNRVLSYQFMACDTTGRAWSGLHEAKGVRSTLSRFLSWVVRVGLVNRKISTWPKKIYLIGHFTLADLTLFSDFKYRKRSFDAIRRTFISLRPMPCRLYDNNNHLHPAIVTLRDSMLLAPAHKQSLQALGELIGNAKVELEDGEIENMDELLRENPERFKEYALRDPEICVCYSLKIAALNHELTGVFEIPPTLSSIGVNYLLELWRKLGIRKHEVLGTEIVREKPWSEKRKVAIHKSREVPLSERQMYEGFVSECYHGGRNEQYFFGAGEEGVWTDWDLAGAYTTALALIGLPVWKAIRPSRDLDDYQPRALGFAHVRFRFPNRTRFPCLPVRVASGLLFPLSGTSCCAAPEIYLAQRLGAEVEILNGIIVPCGFESRPFESFNVECTRRRKSFKKGSLDELFWKEVGNSTYGKLAQGLRRKRCFDSRTGSYRDLPPSAITNPFFASFITSFIRAVLGEILASLPLHGLVCNATTDGFLTNASDTDVMTATEGPLCRLFAETRLRVCGDVTVLEPKHRIAQPLGWRTRGQATLKSLPGEKIVLAKAGLKPPMVDKEQQNEWIISEFVNRSHNSKQTFKTLRNLPEIWKNGGDLTSKELTRRLSMEYDWKRRASTMLSRPIRSVDHLYFETDPWLSQDEFNACRDAWETYQSQSPRVLKTESDLREFQEYQSINPGDAKLKKPHHAPALTFAKRQFLRALVRSEWGLRAGEMSYSETAEWLNVGGFSTKKSDLENAKRPGSELTEHSVPHTPETDRFVSFIKDTIPEFDESKLFQPQSGTSTKRLH